MGKVVERLRGEKKKWLEGLEVERINIETSKGVFGRRQKVKHKAKAEEPFYTLLRDRHRLERMRMRIQSENCTPRPELGVSFYVQLKIKLFSVMSLKI